MKASLLTFSQTGNTLKVGRSIAKGLQDNDVEVDHLRYLHRKRWRPDDADMIGIGCPCFESQPAQCVPQFLKEGRFDFSAKPAFVYITSGGSPAKTLWHLARAVSATGAKVIGGIQLRGAVTVPTMFGYFQGRPNPQELMAAKEFGHAIAIHFQQGGPIPPKYRVNAQSGGKLYDTIGPWLTAIKKTITPDPAWDAEKCDRCGICVYECPTKNISINNDIVRFKGACLVCYRCWHVCPQNALEMVFSPGKGWIERHLYSEKMERRFGNVAPHEHYGSNLYRAVLARSIKLKYDRKNPTARFHTTTKTPNKEHQQVLNGAPKQQF